MCVCVCVCVCDVYAFDLCKGVGAHDMQHVIQEFFTYLRFWCVCVCVIACVRVCARACVCVFTFVLLVLCLPVCVGETLYDPGSLGDKPFETRDLVP